MKRSALRLVLPALALAAGFASDAAFAQAKVIPAQSRIDFAIKEMGVPVDGKFAKWTADIAFDPKKPEAGRIAFTVDTGSATFGVRETDVELPKPEWFNVAKFPTASFASTSIKAAGGGRFDVAGKLTVKGTAKDVVVPVTVTQAAGTTTAAGQFVIKRNDYRVGEGEWTDTSALADEVQVKFRIALSGVGPL
jgi:polyisoprenoid-binding protein YceI